MAAWWNIRTDKLHSVMVSTNFPENLKSLLGVKGCHSACGRSGVKSGLWKRRADAVLSLVETRQATAIQRTSDFDMWNKSAAYETGGSFRSVETTCVGCISSNGCISRTFLSFKQSCTFVSKATQLPTVDELTRTFLTERNHESAL